MAMAKPPRMDHAAGVPRPVNLALQGGGAHGAFTWGVIDRLLEDGRISVEALVGTSAGAMNAAVTAHGLVSNGRDGARDSLEKFWRAVSEAALFSPIKPSPLDRWMSVGNLDFSPMFQWFDALTRMASPYQINPANFNPLRDILYEQVDFKRIRANSDIKLFTCATNVNTGRIKVFRTHEMTAERVLASACLPFLYQAVEIEGQHYWDGGYMGNPPLYPLFYECTTQDILLVMINPIRMAEVPRTSTEIFDRINEISFNSNLMREMRAIQFVTDLIDKGFDDGGRLKKMRIHTVDAEDQMRRLSTSSKLNAGWPFLCWLRDLGRARGQAFLDEHYDKVGVESSTDVRERFL
ncbi:MAG: patatin-like phospholipase family protein [Burkholderiales bacterium]|nr:patatin-like phospholipase family protein [Burkholderiales bacterium]